MASTSKLSQLQAKLVELACRYGAQDIKVLADQLGVPKSRVRKLLTEPKVVEAMTLEHLKNEKLLSKEDVCLRWQEVLMLEGAFSAENFRNMREAVTAMKAASDVLVKVNGWDVQKIEHTGTMRHEHGHEHRLYPATTPAALPKPTVALPHNSREPAPVLAAYGSVIEAVVEEDDEEHEE